MSESVAGEFAPGTWEVDSLPPEDESAIRRKCAPIDDATKGVQYHKPDKYDQLRKVSLIKLESE